MGNHLRIAAFKLIAIILVLFFTISSGNGGGVLAIFFSQIPQEYDLVAILVEKDLYQLTQNVSGIPSSQTPSTTLKARVDRFAEDLQNKLEKTRTLIITVDQDEKTENIAHVLERFYFEGDPGEPEKNARLKGVIIIGNVPLPIVNKGGTRFLSLFPYTDFEKKIYLWNPETSDFERDETVTLPQPEIWHGVIRPPVSSEDPQYVSLLAKFLDKNHLYKVGHPFYSTFGKNLFYADLFWEQKNINPFASKRYLNYLKHAEDVAYFRYTNEFFQSLLEEVEGELDEEGIGEPNEDILEEVLGASGAITPETEAASAFEASAVPDIQTKELINKYLGKFVDLFTKYPALVNDFARYTGRYAPEENLDSFVNLIVAKDQFTFSYLKEVNSMVEREIDRVVEEELQKNIPLLKEVEIEITEVKPRGSGDTIESGSTVPGFAEDYIFSPVAFVNHSPDGSFDSGNFVTRIFGKEMEELSGPELAGESTGRILDSVNSVSDCSLYRGSPPTLSQETGEPRISKLVEGNRVFDPFTGGRDRTQEEDDAGQDFNIFEEHAGCFYDNASLYGTSQNRCFPEHATDPIFTYKATEKRTSRPVSSDDFRACFDFREKTQYTKYLRTLDWFLEALSRTPPQDYDSTQEMETARTTRRNATLLQIFNFLGSVTVTDIEVDEYASLRLNQIPKTKSPDQITLFQNLDENYAVKLSDILQSLNLPISLFLGKEQENYLQIQLPDHPDVEWVSFRVNHAKVGDISSVFHHKEPTIQTLREQNESQVAKSLPIDNPRYLTFQDENGNRQQIIYPNIFGASTLDEYFEKLREKENELNLMAAASGLPPNSFTGRLTEKFSNLSDLSAPDSERNNLNLAFSRVNREKVRDALEWRWLDVEEKHRYALLAYSNPFKNGFIGERESGYEMLIINALGEADSFTIDLQPNEEPPEELEILRQAQAVRDQDLEAEPPEEEDFGEFEQTAPEVSPDYLFTFQEVSVEGEETHFPWFKRVEKWIFSIRETVTFDTKEGESAEEFYTELQEKQEAEREALDEALAEEDAQAREPPERQTDFTRVHEIELSSPFPVLNSSSGSKTNVFVKLKDKNGKLIEDEASEVSVAIEGESVSVSPDLRDLNSSLEGFQTAVLGKEFPLEFIATTGEAGENTVKVSVSEDIFATIKLKVFNNVHLDVSTNLLGVVANGNQEIPLQIKVLDGAGNVLSGMNGRVSLQVSHRSFGELDKESLTLINGQGSAKFFVKKKAGVVKIKALGGGLLPGEIELRLLPGPPEFLRLEADKEFLAFEPESSLKLLGKVFDANGNAVTTDNQTGLQFEILRGEESASLQTTDPLRVSGGTAEINLFPGEKIGKVLVRVKDSENELTPDILEIPVRMEVTSDDIQQNPPETLVAALLGFDGGNVTVENFLASWFTVSGKNQATLSLTEKTQVSQPIFDITPHGAIHFADPQRVTAKVIPGETPRVEFYEQTFQEMVAEMIVTSKPNSVLKLSPPSVEETEPTIALELLDTVYEATLSGDGQAITLTLENEKIFELSKRGALTLFSDEFTLNLGNKKTFSLQLQKGETVIANITFHQNFDSNVNISGSGPFTPGITILPKETNAKISFEKFFTGNSTNDPRGIVFIDSEKFVTGNQAPGFDTFGIEDSLVTQGIGFTEGTKFGQLFASGNSFGESVRPYLSDIGIVIGDPTVRVENETEEGFSSDSGSFLSRTPENVRELLSLDYDADGDDDLFMVFGSGSIQLLENRGEKLGFLDRGVMLNVGNGIASLAKGDMNNDGRMDLVIAGRDPCRRGETCLDIYENKLGYFERKNFAIQQSEERIQVVKTSDLNNDGRLDIVALFLNGNLRAYYNRGTNIENQGQLIGNLGLTVNPSQNLVKSVLLNYSGMPQRNPEDPASLAKYQELQWYVENETQSLGSLIEEDTLFGEVKKNFIYADLDPRFATSTKFGVDENGGVVENGDTIRYTITLRNSSAGAVNDLKFSDVIPEEMILDRASIRCLNCGGNEQLRAHETANPSRPFYLFGVRIPAGGERIITYNATYQTSVPLQSSYVITVGNNLSDDYPIQDQFPDIMVTSEDNPTGRVRFYYSTSLNAQGRVVYASMLSAPDTGASAETAASQYLSTIQNVANLQDEMLDRANNAFEDRRFADEDGDGLPDSLDDFSGALDTINQGAQALISELKCDAGCIPVPQNAAFLSPGFFSILGTPGPFDRGLPVLAFPTSPLVPVWPITGPFEISQFRLYLSPTLTGGLGIGMCYGPYLLGNCITFAVDVLSQAGVCDAIQGSVERALSTANAAIHDANQGTVLNIGGAQGGGGSTLTEREGGGLVNYSLGSYQAQAPRTRNRRIPGFPAIFTDWAHAQLNEFVDKLLDIPDIYFIYPKLSLKPVTPTVKFSFPGLLTFLNSIPLLNIETEDVILKVPIVTRKELNRFEFDSKLWVQDLATEWEKVKSLWRCATLDEIKNYCDLVEFRVNTLISQINENLDKIEAWLLLPKRILDYRNIEAFLARQIIDYLDTIVQYTGGYLKKQETLMRSWVRAIRNMFEVIQNWQLILNVFIDYNESCDQCKTERFLLKDFILRFFAVLPTPPVIPFPKWPDFVIDISKIQAGLTIRWPALKLKAEPLVFPKLPRIRFPTFPVPQIAISLMLPDFPELPSPPPLPQLPQLPALRLPKLPDLLPRPPKIPELPGEFSAVLTTLKKIVKLLCILRTGLLPVPEVTLKSQIEAMTTRTLNPLLPLDFLVTVQTPTINVEYVDQINFTNFLNFNVENQEAVEVAKDAAKDWNKFTTNIPKKWREYIQGKVQQLEKYTQPKFPFENELQQFGRQLEINIGPQSSLPHADKLRLIADFWQRDLIPFLEKAKEKNLKALQNIPEQISISVEEEPFTPRGDRFEEILKRESNEDFGTEFEKNVASYRDSLIAYVLGLEEEKEFLASDELERASRIALNFPKTEFLKETQRMFVSTHDLGGSGNPAPEKIKVGELDYEKTLEELDDGVILSRLLAQGPSGGSGGSGGAADSESEPEIPVTNLGLYVVNPETGESQRVLAYTGESGQPRKLLFMDYDGDRDQDLVYTTGTDVFLKENYGGSTGSTYHFSQNHIEHFSLTELIPPLASLNRFSNVSESVRDATVSFDKAERDISGYHLIFKKSPKYFEQPNTSGSHNIDFFALPSQTKPHILVEDGEVDIENFPGELARVFLEEGNGSATIQGKKRTIVSSGSGEITVRRDEVIHALGEAEVEFMEASGESYTLALRPNQLIPVTEFFSGELKVNVEGGRIEILGKETLTQNVQDGMAVEEGDMLSVDSGSLTLRFENGTGRILHARDTYLWQKLEDPDNPLAKLSLEPRNYYGKIISFDATGRFGVTGETIFLSPQACGDTTSPFANAGSKEFEVPLLKTLLIDASRSYDGQGNIMRYAIDVNREADSDGDGNSENDRDIEQGADEPVFTLGPFGEVGERHAKLIVFDEALNEGSVDLDISVIEPQIFLNEEDLRNGNISGHVEPRDQNVPITIARNRNGVWERLTTPNADEKGRYYTDESGGFVIDDLDLRDRWVVRNSEGKIVAEINRKLGSIVILDDRYHLEAFPAVPPDFPTRVAIVDQNGVTLTFVFFVPDVNVDTVIDPPTVQYTRETTVDMTGVHIKPLNQQFTFRVIPGDREDYPGGTEISVNNERVAIIDVNGDILFMEKHASHLKLNVKERGFDEPVVFEMHYDNRLIAEIFISVSLAEDEFVTLIEQSEVSGIPRPTFLKPGETPFTDISPQDPLAPILRDLYDKGIIQGYQTPRGEVEFRKNQLITRAEFAKITLEMLCIDPRIEAVNPPSVFSDIPFKTPLDWFYSWTKEGRLRGFIFGYLRARDPATGLFPYRPGSNISRAEASKIVLEALEALGIIDMSRVNQNVEPWYKPFIEIAKNIDPYVVSEKETELSYLLTEGEAATPNNKITRGDFAVMANRVLQVRNCYLFDTDSDGLTDEWEKKYFGDLSEGDDDPDRDLLRNSDEERFKTNPLDPDTDRGGIKDGIEVKQVHTDPLNPADDRPISREGLEEGAYVVKPLCMSCPCLATVELGSQLLPGDILFAAIINEQTSEIFVRSNNVSF